MDCSAEYIEMCRRAVEIQEIQTTYYKTVGEYRQNFFSYPDNVWLPRQDQLQGMWFEQYNGWDISKPDQIDKMVDYFYRFCFDGKTSDQ